MRQIKKALVEIFWLVLAAVLMTLVGLVFVVAAVYASSRLIAGLILGMEAAGPVRYIFAGVGVVAGAGAILFSVRCINSKATP